MIVVDVTALVNYTCYLSEDDSIKVRKYAEEHDCEIVEAVRELYMSRGDDHIDLYEESVESDFCTQSIDSADEEDEDI